MLITYTDYLCVVFVCVCPGEGNVAFNATPNPFHLNKICLNQTTVHQVTTILDTSKNGLFPGHNHLLFTGDDDPSL